MNQPLFYQCVVLDNQDPLMLGRVRARLLTDNYNDMVKSFDDPPWNEEKDKWGNRDPFIFNPLLPFFIYQVPKVDEMVNVLYYNSDFQYRNQFYIQALFSTPTTSPFEYYVGTQKISRRESALNLVRQLSIPLFWRSPLQSGGQNEVR